jgi:hypothetical protein
VQRRLDRLVDALADGSLPVDELKTRLGAENARKTKLTGDLENLAKLAGLASLDLEQLKRGFQAPIADVTALLERQTVQARQMLRKLYCLARSSWNRSAADASGATSSGACSPSRSSSEARRT